jgi:hypothetical protein
MGKILVENVDLYDFSALASQYFPQKMGFHDSKENLLKIKYFR